ncbi:MAG: glucosyl transferase [Candidatus Acidoferrum typicum]|nr:glucosyl transferase [Candidatus Acidoferrum typicum]
MPKPRLSVLIDTYNHEQFIAQAINSVLEQDMSIADVEIIVVDDGSTDRTPEIIRGFEPHVRVLCKKNGGQASAFNAGIPECRGEIIAFLDGDDWWERDKLRSVLPEFEANPEIGAVGNGLFEVNAEGEKLFVNTPDRVYRCFFRTAEEGIWFRELMAYMGTSRLAIRKSVLDKILPVPEGIVIEADEYLATLAVALSGALVIEKPLTNYRLHPGNLYQYGTFDLGKAKRKSDALGCLISQLADRLEDFGISLEIIDALLENRRVEAERLRLSVRGGCPWETFRVEQQAWNLRFDRCSLGYRIFQAMVLGVALIMPPRVFYRMKTSYTDSGLHRIRRVIARAVPTKSLVVRKAAG